ncbi:MAG: DUF3999 family protein [Sphingomonas sp.]|jgi:hypothetical protein|uniref:DUF3999 family protein n=1 Tax=Sphingomonas sp. TaxID=28214 RepID=UPI003568E01A
MKWRLIAVAVALALTGTAHATGDDDPASYPVQVRVSPVAGAPVQRLALPLAILAGSRSAGLADVRLFDAAGRALPIARAPAPAVTARRETRLPGLPILGAADAPSVTGVSVRLDGHGQARLVSLVDGGGDGRIETVAILFDARHLKGPSDLLTLDAYWPVSRPVTFVVEASSDLLHWRTIGERVAFRSPGTTPEMPAIALHDAEPGWVRVSWNATPRLASPVTVRTGIFTATTTHNSVPLMLDAIAPPLTDAHAIEFTVPFATAISAIQIVPANVGALLPVRIFGRDDAERPWQPIGAGTVYRLAAKDGEHVGDPIALAGAHYRYWRIEADGDGPGFAGAPRISFAFAPAEILFVASDRPPLRLVTGRAGLRATYLSADDLLAGSGSPQVSGLPLAAVEASPSTPLQLKTGDAGSGAGRRVALWALLLAATAALGFMAWRLVRRPVVT